MASAHPKESLQLIKNMPERLLRFFTKYPPHPLVQQQSIPTGSRRADLAPKTVTTATTTTSTTSTTSSSDPNAPMEESTAPSSAVTEELPYSNPFLPRKNFTTGKWIGPRYGLRIQADLCKLARRNGVEELLPWTIKRSDIRSQRRLENGKRMKGTGEGQKVKGHAWERQLKPKLEKRRQAMLGMPKLVEEWKKMGHGRGWAKKPKMWPK